MDCIRTASAAGAKWIDLKPEVQRAYNDRLQAELARTVWTQISKSWYKNEAGRVTNNWSASTTAYWWRTRKADLSLYEVVRQAAASPGPATAAAGNGEQARTAA
jgi:hypothetical protein